MMKLRKKGKLKDREQKDKVKEINKGKETSKNGIIKNFKRSQKKQRTF